MWRVRRVRLSGSLGLFKSIGCCQVYFTLALESRVCQLIQFNKPTTAEVGMQSPEGTQQPHAVAGRRKKPAAALSPLPPHPTRGPRGRGHPRWTWQFQQGIAASREAEA